MYLIHCLPLIRQPLLHKKNVALQEEKQLMRGLSSSILLTDEGFI
jgi:hypothetical protein